MTEPSVAVLKRMLPKIKYKPGWYFDIQPITLGKIGGLELDLGPAQPDHRLIIHYIAPDAYAPDEPRSQMFTVTIPNMDEYPVDQPDEAAWLRWLYRVIVYLEEHEAAEFLLINGERRFNPHADGFKSMVGIPSAAF